MRASKFPFSSVLKPPDFRRLRLNMNFNKTINPNFKIAIFEHEHKHHSGTIALKYYYLGENYGLENRLLRLSGTGGKKGLIVRLRPKSPVLGGSGSKTLLFRTEKIEFLSSS